MSHGLVSALVEHITGAPPPARPPRLVRDTPEKFWDHRPGVELGGDHWLWYVGWGPDRELNPQYADVPDVEHAGALIAHWSAGAGQLEEANVPAGEVCGGMVHFDLPGHEVWAKDRPVWKVEQVEPLTLSPSVLCRACGDHGFVREGRWVVA